MVVIILIIVVIIVFPHLIVLLFLPAFLVVDFFGVVFLFVKPERMRLFGGGSG